MISILLCIAIGFMSYGAAELYLARYYASKYGLTPEESKADAAESLKIWGPLVLIAIAAIIPESVLASAVSAEFMLICYGLYVDADYED